MKCDRSFGNKVEAALDVVFLFKIENQLLGCVEAIFGILSSSRTINGNDNLY
jgi:hypothetical protein